MTDDSLQRVIAKIITKWRTYNGSDKHWFSIRQEQADELEDAIKATAGKVRVNNSRPYWLVENRNAEWYAGGTCCGFVKDTSLAVRYPTKEAADYFIENLPVVTRIGLFSSEHVDIRQAALSAQTEARDAARYRWLRDHCNYGVMGSDNPPFALNCDEPASEWDAAIDREIAQGDL